MATTPRSQIPLKFEFLGNDKKLTQPWAFYLQTLDSGLPPQGSGYVVDGTAGTTGPTTIYQGPASGRGSNPSVNSVYIADDTGQIFTVTGGMWQEQSSALTGDVTKPAHSHITTLVNVNSNVGTFGDGSNIPVITVNAKGLITGVTSVPIIAPPLALPGKIGDMIFKLNSQGDAGTNELFTTETFTVTYKLAFYQSDATPWLVASLPVNTVVSKIELTILTAFDGTSPTLAVGAGGVFNDLMDTTDNIPTVLSNWAVEPGIKYTSATDVYVTIAAGSGSAGYALIVMTTVQV